MADEEVWDFSFDQEAGHMEDAAAGGNALTCMACDCPRHGKKKWCLIHNRGADCMLRRAAKLDKDNQTDIEVKACKRKLDDPTTGLLEVARW
eukprot:13194118-Alexandrium_andersonii.AAC.1